MPHKKKSESPRWTGGDWISGHKFAHFKNSAKKRNLAFTVSVKDLEAQMHQQAWRCAYTGILLNETTASLDRRDSDTGYTPENVQWVYEPVNHMKWDLPETAFKFLCRLVTQQEKDQVHGS